ncbi:MAG: hypothetical protein KDD70_07705 [Bdellovibrionales bacterium]|nr:hypothetical protein [Bdellovibrionales bacterium]
MKLVSHKAVLIGILLCFCCKGALAEHPIEVQRLTANGKYFEALTLYEQLPRRTVNSEATEAAGRSAWGLGMSERAAEFFDTVLRDESLSATKRARLLLMRGTIELQEHRPRVAILFAERAYEQLTEPTKLRGAVLLLWGDAFAQLKTYGPARKKFEEAIEEISHELVPEVALRLAIAARALGETDAALAYLRKVPVSHSRAPEAIRALAELSLEREDYPAVHAWLQRGVELYPDSFLDSWVQYALVRAAAAAGEYGEVRKLREEALKNYPPSDSWVSLLEAIAEKAEWNHLKQDE